MKISHYNPVLQSRRAGRGAMKSFLLLFLLRSAEAGCRWYSPAWKESLESAPEVKISPERWALSSSRVESSSSSRLSGSSLWGGVWPSWRTGRTVWTSSMLEFATWRAGRRGNSAPSQLSPAWRSSTASWICPTWNTATPSSGSGWPPSTSTTTEVCHFSLTVAGWSQSVSPQVWSGFSRSPTQSWRWGVAGRRPGQRRWDWDPPSLVPPPAGLSDRRFCPTPAWPSALAGPPDLSSSRRGRRHYSESPAPASQSNCKYSVSSCRISWNIRQLSHSQCISFFLLKYWHSSDFVPKYSTLKFVPGQERSSYEGELAVMPCTTYTYVLTVAFSVRKTSDIQGRAGCRAECNFYILMDRKTLSQ